MPLSPVDGKPLYNAGSSVADVFTLCARPNGATVAEIKRALNSDVAIYPLTRHADTRGRRGLRWNLTIDGKSTEKFSTDLPSTARVQIVNVRKSDAFVNSTHPRSTPGNTAQLVSARSVQSAVAPAAVAPAAVAPAAVAKLPTTAKTTTTAVVKSTAKRVKK